MTVPIVFTADVSDRFLTGVVAMCQRLAAGGVCRPEDFIGCWSNESEVRPHAQNPSALASGFFQVLPSIARGMGFVGDLRYTEPRGVYNEAIRELHAAEAGADAGRLAMARQSVHLLNKSLADAFCRLPLESQLIWAERYYRPYMGRLTSPTACYAANFVPAFIKYADKPDWVICAKDGFSNGLSAKESTLYYKANAAGLDVDKDGKITMGDLAAAIQRAMQGSRAKELTARVMALDPEATQPELDVTAGGTDNPLFVSPPLEEEDEEPS